MTIPDESIVKAVQDNVTEILKDVLTGYNSPVRKMLEDKDSDFQKQLVTIATEVFTAVIKDPKFQEQLKDKFLVQAIENMMKR